MYTAAPHLTGETVVLDAFRLQKAEAQQPPCRFGDDARLWENVAG